MVDESPSLEERVLAELLSLRKSRSGVTLASIAHADTICQLLGAGDPYVAFSKLRHQVLDSDLGLSIRAAASSLGLLAEGESHLARLVAFGEEAFLEQRQVRRYSDKGIRELARLITTNWPTETSPQLTAIISPNSVGWEMQVTTARLNAVEMKDPQVAVLVGAETAYPELSWKVGVRGAWFHSGLREPIFVYKAGDVEISVVVVWRGELWPKFNTVWLGTFDGGTVETLGTKLMLRLAQP